MSARLDLKGKEQGRLKCIGLNCIKNQTTWWDWKCKCGGKTTLRASSKTESCGCLGTEAKRRTGKQNKNKQTPLRYIKDRIKINKNGCWVWQKSTIKGYARLTLKTIKINLTSRYVYKYIKGIDPKEKQVCHTCDNPLCVNPDHLFLGSVIDNLSDMKNKDRSCRGERNTKAKLTEEEVIKIRKLKGKLKNKEIADIFNVSESNIKMILRGATWKYLL